MGNFDGKHNEIIGLVYTARLVSKMDSNKVSAVVSGTGSHMTFIFDVTEHCELPFQRNQSQSGKTLHLISFQDYKNIHQTYNLVSQTINKIRIQ